MLLLLTTGWDNILLALRKFRLPDTFVSLLGISYRYIHLLLRNLLEIMEARKSRIFTRLPFKRNVAIFAQSSAYLFLKTMHLAENVTMAIESRGGHTGIRQDITTPRNGNPIRRENAEASENETEQGKQSGADTDNGKGSGETGEERISAETAFRIEGVTFTYKGGIKGVEIPFLEVESGKCTVLLGANGSGKSTLAKCLNGLLLPTEGDVWVRGHNTREERESGDIRATVGIVFQNPDNQFVCSSVEEEIAFGPENLGIPQDEIRDRVEHNLREANLSEMRHQNPSLLSAGQKARLAIASILAMAPQCLILDESTAMLDPVSRQDTLTLLEKLHQEGLAIVAITHFMDEATLADRVLVLEKGDVALEGSPHEVFSQANRLEELGLALPPAASIAQGLARRGLDLPKQIISQDELVSALTTMAGKHA